jgi:hypothetical protein
MIAGALLVVAAVFQWLTFDYPDVNPLWPGAVFAPGMISQVVNWIVVCVLGGTGCALITVGKSKTSRPDHRSRQDE